MTTTRSMSRSGAACLLLMSGILVLGLVQWSFLPLLVQRAPVAGGATLEVVAGHTSKFAAPFKALFVASAGACLVPSPITLRTVPSRPVRVVEAPTSSQSDFSLTHRPPRAPPSV